MALQDVFLRELVSNAADACDKKRFLALTNSDAPPEPMKLRINTDKARQPMEFLPMGCGLMHVNCDHIGSKKVVELCWEMGTSRGYKCDLCFKL